MAGNSVTKDPKLTPTGGCCRPTPSSQLRCPTIVDDLASTVDCVRQIATDLGDRVYRVFLAHVLWDGPRRGDGEGAYTFIEILPTPKVSGVPGLVLDSPGLDEEGNVRVTEISVQRYTEDDLMGRTPDLIDPVDPTRRLLRNAEFFWLVVQRHNPTPRPKVRRYVPVGVPERFPFQWQVSLVKQDADLGRGFEDLRHVVGAV